MLKFTAEQHQTLFADFARKVKAISGATPHLTLVGESCAGLAWEEIVWRGGAYAATYNYPAAEVLWQNFSPEKIRKQPKKLVAWVHDNWKGLPLRRERKAVNAPARLAECIVSFATWQQARAAELRSARLGYFEAWDIFNEVRYMGRYIAIRFLEYMHRYGGLRAALPDSRPNGGRYPRQGLSLLYPESAEVLLGGNSFVECRECNKVAERCIAMLRKEHDVWLDHYTLQSLICEYKQAALGGKQYPVQALDSELGYYNRVAEYWGSAYTKKSQFFKVRKGVFAHQALGELGGWTGKRKELGTVLREYGYNWSDLEYDYMATKDFAHPVKRQVSVRSAS